MNQRSATPGDNKSTSTPRQDLSGRLGVGLLLAALALAFGTVSLLVFNTPLSSNELGLLGGLQIKADEDTVVFVGNRRVGAGTVDVAWNELLGAVASEPLAVVNDGSLALAGDDAELLWSEQGPTGAHRGTTNANFAFNQQLYRRADGSLDHLIVIYCEFPDAEGSWQKLAIPVRARREGDEQAGYFPRPGTQSGGNISRGMIPSRRDSATFQLKLEIHPGVSPSTVDMGDKPARLWQPDGEA